MAESKNQKDTFKCWTRYAEEPELAPFIEELSGMLSRCKTERETVRELEADLAKRGIPLEEAHEPAPGDIVFFSWKGRALLAAKIGQKSCSRGVSIVGAHADSPRIDVKASPLYEDSNLALWDCHYYGGIKKYHWPNRSLALHGEIHLKDGRSFVVSEGERPQDPVFMIPDLAPHLDREMDKRKASETILGENLDAIVASRPAKDVADSDKQSVLSLVREYLSRRWEIEEQDLAYADLSFVPSGAVRDVGFDRALMAGYGLDDRVCVFASYLAFRELAVPTRTAVFLAVDREEIGSEGIAGAQSEFLDLFLQELLERTGETGESLDLKRCLSRSYALSADVTEAVNPIYKEAFDPHQLPLVGNGIALMKGTGVRGKYGGSEARGEFFARVVNGLEEHGVPWQVGSLGKVDKGGGGTIAMFLARKGLDVLDAGPCVLSLHSPLEAISKADAFCASRAYSAFWMMK